jgi:hypothetical protein
MKNAKFSMTDFQFGLNPLVAACRATSWRLRVKTSSLSVESVKTVVQFLWFRLAARDCLSIFAANLQKCLSMNDLQSTMGSFQPSSIKVNQGQSTSIKVNQGKSR